MSTTISKEEWLAMEKGRKEKKQKRNKYAAQKCEYAGYWFASQLERDLFILLKELEKEETVGDIQTQAEVLLTEARIIYKADFKVVDHDCGEFVWYEAKGFETPEWRLKRRLWLHYGPGRLRIYKRWGKNHVKLHEEITPYQKTRFCTCQTQKP